MPSIGDMQYGFETAGIETYIEEVRANSLEKAQNDADDISEIRSALDATWEGASKDAYLAGLVQDIAKFKEALANLYTGFVTEVHNASESMKNFDSNLIK